MDGTVFASGRCGKLVKISIDSFEKTSSERRLHDGPVRCVSVKDSYVISGSADGTIVISDSRTLLVVCNLLIRCPIWSCCWISKEVFCCGCQDGSTLLYDIRNTSVPLDKATCDVQHKPVTSLVYSSDASSSASLLIAGSNNGIFTCKDVGSNHCSWSKAYSGECQNISQPIHNLIVALVRSSGSSSEYKVCIPSFYQIVFHFAICCIFAVV